MTKSIFGHKNNVSLIYIFYGHRSYDQKHGIFYAKVIK
ncbi:hypothetical protein SBV1_gp42 [Sulfolobales Beppu virus 1]|nr:hypothetical protein SBV1_gp42 [Sulfolobales Beppu virus 1]